MPHPTCAATMQPSPDDRHNHPPRSHTRSLMLLVGVALLFPAAAMTAPEASAGSRSCTGWTSSVIPPTTIRVGRAGGSGQVETVPFKHYVAIAMAREWPHYLPQAAIEAGAVAVKQYAWYHAMAGHHRRTFRTAGGACYDVVDSTRDQLYEPEEVGIHPKIRQAVDATWSLSVQRGGRLFMTGYRAGSSRRCGADADGWRLFARSVIACARQGLSRAEILQRYYGPIGHVISAGQAQAAAAASKQPAGSRARGRESDSVGTPAAAGATQPQPPEPLSTPPTPRQPTAQRHPWLPYKV